MRLKERDITAAVRDFLAYRGWRAVRINAGPFGKAGMPDYLFLHYKRREALWIEFKSPSGRLSPRQLAWIQEELRQGARVWVVRDVDEFMTRYAAEWGQQRLVEAG